MKILLVQPPVRDFYFTPHRCSSLGLQSLASAWSKRGHECVILNFPLKKPLKKSIPLPEKLAYLSPYLKKHSKEVAPTSFFNHYFHFGPDFDACADEIWNLRPDVVAVSCFAWAYADPAIQLLDRLKKKRRAGSFYPLLTAGGPGVTVMPEYFLPCADLAVTGEGESAILDIEKAARNKMSADPGGRIIHPGACSRIPFVWDLKTRGRASFLATALLTRGCPKMCSFCANHLVFGKRIRKPPLDDVFSGIDQMMQQMTESVGDIETVRKNQNTVHQNLNLHINFEDDNILFETEYFLKILNYINRQCHHKKISFSFSAENGMDYMLLNGELIDQFNRFGLSQFNLSMASTGADQLKKENRPGSLEKLEKILHHCSRLDIPSITYFICGLKHDTPEKTVAAISYLHRLETRIGISLYYPVPGLSDWPDKDLFASVPACLCCGSSASAWNNSLDTKQLITAFRLARASNHIKSAGMDTMGLKKLKNDLMQDITMDKKMVGQFFSMAGSS